MAHLNWEPVFVKGAWHTELGACLYLRGVAHWTGSLSLSKGCGTPELGAFIKQHYSTFVVICVWNCCSSDVKSTLWSWCTHTHNNTLCRYCLYPQEIVICFSTPARIRKLQILSHQYMIGKQGRTQTTLKWVNLSAWSELICTYVHDRIMFDPNYPGTVLHASVIPPSASTVELYVGRHVGGRAFSMDHTHFTRLGYISLSENEQTGFRVSGNSFCHSFFYL